MNGETGEATDGLPKRSNANGRGTGEHGAPEDHMIDETGDSHDDTTYRLQFDREVNAELSTAIVRKIAEETGDDPTGIEPLYHTIDPQVIDSFTDRNSASGALAFTYHGHDIEVGADGEVTFRASDE